MFAAYVFSFAKNYFIFSQTYERIVRFGWLVMVGWLIFVWFWLA